MLRHVETALAQLGLMQPAQRLRYYINLTTGEAMSISAFASEQRFFQIKASELVDLTGEYAAYRRAWKDFPDFVPRPYGYHTHDRWCMMVSEGVAHRPFPVKLIAGDDEAHASTATRDLLRYFELGGLRARAHPADSQTALLQTLREHFAATPYAALSERWLEHAEQYAVHSLAPVPQHGDFVVNNLAVSGSRLVVFDWEDYGRVDLQGLDLATLAMSVWRGEHGQLRALAQPHAELAPAMQAFLRRACALSGIEFELFRLQMPLYVLVFLYLKRNYGSLVQQIVGDLLRQLSA